MRRGAAPAADLATMKDAPLRTHLSARLLRPHLFCLYDRIGNDAHN